MVECYSRKSELAMPPQQLVLEVCVDSVQSAVRFALQPGLAISHLQTLSITFTLPVLRTAGQTGSRYAVISPLEEAQRPPLGSSRQFGKLSLIYQSW